jgi:hypothetical protein
MSVNNRETISGVTFISISKPPPFGQQFLPAKGPLIAGPFSLDYLGHHSAKDATYKRRAD